MISFKRSAVFLGAIMGVSAAMAIPLSGALIPGTNTLSDDNAEIVLKYDSGLGGYRQFVVGVDTIQDMDILVGMVGITSFPTSGVDASSVNEVTGLYAVQASGAPTGLPGVVCGSAFIASCEVFSYSYANIGLNAALGLANSLYGTAFGTSYANVSASSFAVILEDTTADFTRLGTLTAASASASDGDLRIVLDLLNGDSFTAVGPSDVAELALVQAGQGVGSISGAATVSFQDIPNYLITSKVRIQGSLAQATGGQFPIWSNTDYTFEAQYIPEPGSLALAGLALLGLGASRRQFK